LNRTLADKKEFKIFYALPLIAWMAVIFVLSSIPGDALPHTDVKNADKIAHLTLYGILAVLSVVAFSHYASAKNRSLVSFYVVSTVVCLGYGASDEIHQLFVRNRSCDIFDFLADAAAVIIVHVLLFYSTRKADHVSS
jgi:VanZ family protein